MHVDTRKQDVGDGGLADKIGSAGMEPLRNTVGILAAREEDNRQIVQSVHLADTKTHFEPVQARHVDIEQDKVHPFVLQPFKSLFARSACHDTIPDMGQKRAGLIQHFDIVVYNENSFLNHVSLFL